MKSCTSSCSSIFGIVRTNLLDDRFAQTGASLLLRRFFAVKYQDPGAMRWAHNHSLFVAYHVKQTFD